MFLLTGFYFCLVIVALIVFILGKRLGSFSIPAVAATVSAIVALALPAHLGNAGLSANSLGQAVRTSNISWKLLQD